MKIGYVQYSKWVMKPICTHKCLICRCQLRQANVRPHLIQIKHFNSELTKAFALQLIQEKILPAAKCPLAQLWHWFKPDTGNCAHF